jgi:hypothetical protein
MAPILPEFTLPQGSLPGEVPTLEGLSTSGEDNLDDTPEDHRSAERAPLSSYGCRAGRAATPSGARSIETVIRHET